MAPVRRAVNRIQCPKPKKKGEKPPVMPFPPIRFHNLRHSATTLLLTQGVSPRYITDLLGHSQVSQACGWAIGWAVFAKADLLAFAQTIVSAVDEASSTDDGMGAR